MTVRLVNNRSNPSIVRRQNKSTEPFSSSNAAYHREALRCWGCRSQVIASQTLISTKYEVIRRFSVRASGSPLSLSRKQRQSDALAAAGSAYGHNPGHRLAALRHDDPLVR